MKIKEPDGIDFVIQSTPLTDSDRKEISSIITKLKSKIKSKPRKKTIKKQNKPA